MVTLYVGNLSYSCNEQQLKDEFSKFSMISSVKMVNDKETGKFKGFAFIDVADSSSANILMSNFNGREFLGRKLIINEARPREFKPKQDYQKQTNYNRY